MGQGLHTKLVQVASQCFGIPARMIFIKETSTDTVANASATAASLSTDLYGTAVLDACTQISNRLAEVKRAMSVSAGEEEGEEAAGIVSGERDTAAPSVGVTANDVEETAAISAWKRLVFTAFSECVSLSAHGHYALPAELCTYDMSKPFLRPSNTPKMQGGFHLYFTTGVAVSEVEIDCLTGDSRVLRADVLMDIGKSINPALDIGQIEGAFVQGFGWSVMEEMIRGDSQHTWVKPRGRLLTAGPGNYKIPSADDVPIDFRVQLADTDNPFAIHSSRAIGEPGFFLGCSVACAIRAAVEAARAGRFADDLTSRLRVQVEGAPSVVESSSDHFTMDWPASSERIRMLCEDSIARLCVDGASSSSSVVNVSDEQSMLDHAVARTPVAAFSALGSY
jgi:xanthine dehydrogenase/oxidase